MKEYSIEESNVDDEYDDIGSQTFESINTEFEEELNKLNKELDINN